MLKRNNIKSDNPPKNLKTYPTSYFVNYTDYQEGSLRENGDVLFGSIHHLEPYGADLIKNGRSSFYYGRVLCPERKDRQFTPWDYYKNMAFWAGLIDHKRSLLLITDIAQYPNSRNQLSGTLSEIFWLLDNGYAYQPDPDKPQFTYFYPDQSILNPKLIDYTTANKEDCLKRMEKIRDAVFSLRNQEIIDSSEKRFVFFSDQDSQYNDSYKNNNLKKEENINMSKKFLVNNKTTSDNFTFTIWNSNYKEQNVSSDNLTFTIYNLKNEEQPKCNNNKKRKQDQNITRDIKRVRYVNT